MLKEKPGIGNSMGITSLRSIIKPQLISSDDDYKDEFFRKIKEEEVAKQKGEKK